MKTTLYFIRHGETVWNLERRVQGFKDSPLSKSGEEQARALKPYLVPKNIHVAYASDAGRCLQTAQLALEGTSVSLTALTDLRERNLGVWEGQIFDDVVGEDPEGFKTYRATANYRMEGGETFQELQDRAYKAIEDILEKHPGKNIAIFTSGGTMRSVAMRALKADPDPWAGWTTANTGIITLQRKDDEWRMINFNVTPHLES